MVPRGNRWTYLLPFGHTNRVFGSRITVSCPLQRWFIVNTAPTIVQQSLVKELLVKNLQPHSPIKSFSCATRNSRHFETNTHKFIQNRKTEPTESYAEQDIIIPSLYVWRQLCAVVHAASPWQPNKVFALTTTVRCPSCQKYIILVLTGSLGSNICDCVRCGVGVHL